MTGSKVKNAAAVVLKIKAESLPLFTRADYDVWVLRHMLRPIKPEELNDEYIEVIDITERLDSLEWVKDDLPATLDGSAGSPLHADIPPTPATSNPPTALPNDQLWRITPETHIYSFAERYRMVVVVDVTPSMAVVDDTMGKAKALISSAFETLCKTLDGVCRPFLMGSSLKGEPLHVRPDVYITVLAESGTTYFRGDQSPLAQKFAHTFPTRVLIQEVLVTRDNLALIAERLYDALNAYENDLVQQRQRDTPRERPPSEESLIVGNDSEGNLAFNASSATQVEALAELAGYGGTASKIALDSIPTDSIFRSIERALFALNVLPDNCLSCLVYITDGVISTAGSGEQIARDCCRKIARENAVFTLIQVGVGHGYIPGTNLGHVADNEFLRFLAVAAAGKFLYAADCNYLDSTVGAPVETFAPNFYHRHMLIRQNTFTKAGPESRYRAVNGSSYERLVDCPRGRLLNASVDTTQNISQEELSFPWEPTSKPPLVAEILCGYRDYTLNVVLENVVLARLNEGFILLSVHQTRRRSRDRPDKIEVILIMPWFTNVTILYTIKSVWVDQSKPMLLDRAHHKAPRIELNILAQHAFAILFINVQNLEQKSSYSASIEDKLVKLHGFLKGVYEADDALKVLASFNTKYALSVIPQTEQRLFGATTDDYVNNMTSFGSRGQLQSKAVVQNSKQANNYWHVLGQIIASKWASFNEWTVDVILRTTSGGIESARGNKRQVATIYLNEFLTSEWCTFAMEKTRLLKFVFQESSPIASGEVSGASKATRIPTGFALLSSSWDNECLVSLRLNFFSMSVTERLDMVSELTREILNIRHIIRTTGVEFRPLIVCKKPISELLVRYVPQTSDLGSMREMSDDRDIASLSNPKITTTPPDSEPTSPATSPIPPNPADTTQNHFQLSNPSLRAYLRNNRWVWLSDIAIREAELEGYSDRVPVHELAFLLMYRQRLDEGYVPVSESNGLLTLYREVQIPRRKLDTRQFGPNQFSHSTCSLQFVLLKDDIHKTVCSELWVEPIVDGPAGSALALDHKTENYPIGTLFKEHYDRVAEHILDFDRKLLNKLFTFDEIHAIGRAGGGRPGDGKYGTRGKNWSVSKGVTAVTTRFHLESVLEDGYFVTIANHAPVVFGDDLDGGDWGQQGAGGRTQMGLSPGNHLTSATPTMLTGLDANEGATDTPPSMLGRSLNPSRGNGIAGGNTPVPLSRATSHRVLGSHGAAGPGLTVSIPPSKSNLFEGLVNPSPGYRLSFEAVFLATTRRSRVALTLCRFLERVVGLLTDGEITLSDQSLTVTNPIGPIESGPLDFLEKIEAALKQHRDSLISDENQPSVDLLIRRICDSKCFVKIRDRHSFLLIFCPQYPLDTDQRSLDKTEKSDELDNDALPYLTTTIVECTRPGLAPAGTPLTNTPPFEPKSESQNEDATIQFGEWALLVRSGKELTDGCILAEGPGQRLKTRSSAFTSKATASVPPAESAKSLPSSKISDFTRQFLQKLDDGYKSAFLKTVYAALLQGYDLRKEDLDAAISACTETSIDIDITGYLNVRILSDRLRLKAEAGSEVPEREWDDEAVQKHFHEALAEHFWPVPCSGEEPPNNIYYYHPFTHKEESASDNPPSFTPQTSSTLSLSLPTGGILAASQSSSNLLAKPIPVVGPMRRNLTPEAYSAQTPGGHFSHSTSASSSQFEILFRQLECADTPLFIRTECSFRKRTMMDAEHSHIPVKNLPKSYRINSEDKAPLAEHLSTMDFTPDFVGTYASPVESRDGTRAILHLVCMTIPPLSSSEDARMNIHNVRPAKIDQSGSSQSPTHDSAPDNESYEMQEQGLAEDRLLSSLDADKQDALENVSKKIEDLLDDEIMHSLLDLERVQGPSLRLIEGILRKRHGLQTQINEGAASPTFSAAESGPSLAINFPLVFVSPEAGIDMFQTEFENINLGIGRVKRFGDLFCVIPDDKNVQDTREVEVDKAQLSRSVSEFGVQGLGISMDGLPEEFAGRTTDNHDAAKSVEDNQEPQPRSRPKFWLIITVAGFSAQVYFFSKVVTPYQRLMIIRQVRKGVSTCCERVNRFYLLGCLNETHTASKYLIAPASSVDDWSSQSLPTTKDEDALSTSSCLSEHDHTGRFPYGRFACPVVFKRSFPLHWRLRPQQALNNIVTALEAFGISNRKNMFVFAAKGSVFYMRVSVLEIEAVERGNEPGKGKEREQESKFEMNTTSPAELASPNMGRPDSPKAPHSPTMRRSTVSSFPPVSVVSGGTSNGPTNPRSAEFALVLDVYGIDKPGPQITSEFVNMIDVKINSLTQHVLGTFLARNVTIKLTPADLDFILPAAKGVEPARLEVLNLPPIIRSPYVFMLLMRQSLLNWLHVLGGADVVSALRNHYEQSYGWADRDADTPLGSKTYEVQLSDFSFLYNCIPTRNPTSSEAAIGPGIACICLALLDNSGKIILEVPAVGAEGDSENPVNLKEIAEALNDLERQPLDNAPGHPEYKLMIEIWYQGSINLDNLVTLLKQAFRNTLADYVVESAVGTLSTTYRESPFIPDSDMLFQPPSAPTSPRLSGRSESREQINENVSGQVDVTTTTTSSGAMGINDQFSDFYQSLFTVLKRALECQVPTVAHLSSPVKLPPWIIEEFVAEIHELLIGSSISLAPVILRREGSEGGVEFVSHRPMKRSHHEELSDSTNESDQDRSEDLFVIVSGVTTLNARYGPWRPQFAQNMDRKHSFELEGSNVSLKQAVIANATTATGVTATSIQSPLMRAAHEDSTSETATTASVTAQHRRGSRAFHAATQPSASTHAKSAKDSLMLYPGNLHSAVLDLGSRSDFLIISMTNGEIDIYAYNCHKSYTDLIFGQVFKILSWNNLRIQFLQHEISTLNNAGAPRKPPFRVPESDRVGVQEIAASFGGDSIALAMANQFAQRVGPKPMANTAKVDDTSRSLSITEVDILQKHAVEFLDWFVRQLRVNDAKTDTTQRWKVGSLHAFGVEPPSKPMTDTSSCMSAADMAEILRSVRLLHFVKYPLLFTELRDQFFGMRASNATSPQSATDQPSAKDSTPSTGVTPAMSGTSQVASPSPWSNNMGQDDTECMNWYHNLVETYLGEYVTYLETLGLESVNETNTRGAPFSPSTSVIPKFWISERLSVDSNVIYLVRWFKTGIIIAQIGVDGVFGCVNLYTLSYSEGLSGHLAAELEGRDQGGAEADEVFAEAGSALKNLIHLSSYSYDFHLRYFQKILERSLNSPTPVDILPVMKMFTQFNPRKANFARSRIYHGRCCIDEGQVSSSLFQYILKNPLRYGFFPILFQEQPVACSLISTAPDFSRPGSAGPDDHTDGRGTVYSIVVYSTSDDSPVGTPIMRGEDTLHVHQRKASAGTASTSTRLNLRYFLLIVNTKTPAPHREADPDQSAVMGNAMMFDSLHEYLAGGYYLKDIVRNAERKVERLVEQALRYYGRDNLWRQLWKNEDPMSLSNAVGGRTSPGGILGTNDGMCEWTKMFLEKIAPNSRPVLDIDPELTDLFTNPFLPLHDLLDFLKSYYPYSARDLVEGLTSGRRHLVLFNPYNEDYLLHFIVISPVHSAATLFRRAHGRTTSVSSDYTALTTPRDPSPTPPTIPRRMTISGGNRSDFSLLPPPAGSSSRTQNPTPPSLSALDSSLPALDPPVPSVRPSSAPRPRSPTVPPSIRSSTRQIPLLSTSTDLRLEVYAVSREGMPDEAEYKHIGQVVNTISYWLWNRVAQSSSSTTLGALRVMTLSPSLSSITSLGRR